MPALSYLYQILYTFRHLFSRRLPWVMFCAVILGFIGGHHVEAITSLCRFWQMDETGYHQLLHFFHSSAWCLNTLVVHWQSIVLSQHVAVVVQGRTVLLGDHTYVVKDARRMPGVVTLHQESETQSKPTYFRGHHWGIVGLLAGSLAQAFCLPLEARLHQGFAHLRQNQHDDTQRQNLALRLVDMALAFALHHQRPSIVVLDAFFAVAPVFQRAAAVWSTAIKQPYLAVITRAKKNYVAYEPAPPKEHPAPGRPRKYGKKIKLKEVFETYQQHFLKAPCQVYGQVETISYLVLTLLWKPIKAPLRFVFAITSRGPIVLMCSDLDMAPLTVISLYCARVRVETMFSMLKHLLGAFTYRFWSKYLPRHSRKPKKNADLKAPMPDYVDSVRITWQACERFVMLGCIALGLLQLVALKFSHQVWQNFNMFLRTRSRTLPSERTVKAVIAQEVTRNFRNVAALATMPIIDTSTSAQRVSDQNSFEREPLKAVNA